MRVQLKCTQCANVWALNDEPRALIQLTCPQCGVPSEPRAAEDLASSLEDALCQLWLLGKTVELEIVISTANLPTAFKPSS
jgi:hypothetical protein